MNNLDGFLHTGGLFVGGAYFFSLAETMRVKVGHKDTVIAMSFTLLASTVLISTVVQKIFDTLGWHPPVLRRQHAELLVSWLGSSALISAAAIRFGFAPSIYTGAKVSLMISSLFAGFFCIDRGLQKVYGANYNADQRFNEAAGLFGSGSLYLLLGAVAKPPESPTNLLAIGAAIFPLASLIRVATTKIFDALGLHPGGRRDATEFFVSWLGSIALTSAAAVRFGFTGSLYTGLRVSILMISLFRGLSYIHQSLQNIYQGANNRVPGYLREAFRGVSAAAFI